MNAREFFNQEHLDSKYTGEERHERRLGKVKAIEARFTDARRAT
jgi:hypothetical protein